MSNLLPLLFLLPFLAALLAGPVVRRTPKHAGIVLAIAPFLVLLLLAYLRVQTAAVQTFAWPWAEALGIEFSLRLDSLSLLFATLIAGIGVLVSAYASGYMHDDGRLVRFYASLYAFMGSMLGLVFSGDLITLFLFWELTSVTSFLLIGFDHTQEKSRAAATQAILVTGLGGLAMLAGFIVLGQAAGSYAFDTILSSRDALVSHPHYLPALALILLGAFTKSAQFPFHFWLPNAMAAPTPVSAYLHSSTMVKAGVFLLARLFPALGGTTPWMWSLCAVGGITALAGGILALRHTTMKPVLAYTTISALGLLITCLGIGTSGAIKALVTFLLVHAFYKAALFMVAGALDHQAGEKDAEKLSGLRRMMPRTAAAAGLAALSMAGLPPLLGFIGKEVLYEAAWGAWTEQPVKWAFALLLLALVAANVVNVMVALLIAWRPFWARGERNTAAADGHPALWLGPLTLGFLGVLFGLYAAPLADVLIAPAATQIFGADVEVKLVLWHGITPPLILSIVTVLSGLALFTARRPLRHALCRMPLESMGPEAIYNLALRAMMAFARLQTRILQNGYLRIYLLSVLAFVILLPGLVVVRNLNLINVSLTFTQHFLVIAVMAVILAGAFAVTLTSSRMAAVCALGLVGIGMSLVYVLHGAPDLAMTQFVIEILTVILFLLVLKRLPAFSHLTSRRVRARDAFFAASGGAFMSLLVIAAGVTDPAPNVAEYYKANSVPLAYGRNTVNTILVDFRALDTLGEITVLALAGIGAFGLLRLRIRRRKP